MTDSKEGRGDVRIYSCIDDLTTKLAEYISDLSDKSVKERGCFSIALSGRSTVNFIWKLTGAPYMITVDWTKWRVFFADERAVAKTHPESNYKLTKDEFLSKVPIPSSNVCSINDNLEIGAAAHEYQFTIRQHVKSHKVAASVATDCPRFDLILLELGPDGHVASLFPGHAALCVYHDWVTHIVDSPRPPPERITFTMPVINSACNVAIVAVEDDKADAVRFAVGPIDESVVACLSPARMVDPVDGRLVWFLDSGAASKLD
ncbi:putative 6-phosphogluconolactonase 1 [Carex littledalei]|uniref:Probable 6-phosphogluconolactonase n=1 Tax=Carex littledalei TaxID=544730 RepID=A0A833R676_9POAL|nr:putative 6-phosphogluconolactonase 1 [Carex littledalei]